MADYATSTDVQNVGIPAAAFARFSAAAVTEALANASRTADSYLRQQYTLPLTAWDASLTRAVVSIAVYDLMSSNGLTQNARDDTYRQRYEDAIKWLEGVAKGQIVPDVTDSTPTTPEGDAVVVCDPPRGWSGAGYISGG